VQFIDVMRLIRLAPVAETEQRPKTRDLSTNCATMRALHITWGSPQLIAGVTEISLYGDALPVQHML